MTILPDRHASRTLPSRLDWAIRALTPEQIEHIHHLAHEMHVAGGLRSQIASVVGMPAPTVLSDIIGGRTPGIKYIDKLAELLGVGSAWLKGDDDTPPDLYLNPLEAWERFAAQLTKQWQAVAEPNQPRHHDDSQMDLVAPQETLARLVRMTGLPADHPELMDLSAGRFSRCTFEHVVALARGLNLPALNHPDHLRHGHATARLVEERIERSVRQAKRRFKRYLPPPALFQVARKALLASSFDRREVNDLLEFLWRQQLQRSGQPKIPMPEEFRNDTGRTIWTPLEILADRHEDDA